MDYPYFLYFVLSPINSVLSVIFNGLEIFYLLNNQNKELKSFVYFLNLAISDVLLGFIIITTKIMRYFELQGHEPSLTKARLIIQQKILHTSLYISVLTIGVLMYERMYAIKKPVNYREIKTMTRIKISVLIWILAIAVVVVMGISDNRDIAFALYPVIVVFIGILGIVCYIVIKKTLRKKMVKFRAADTSDRKEQGVEKEFLKFCTVSIILFVVSWAPIGVFGFFYTIKQLQDWKGLLYFQYTVHIIAFSNSVQTPILFFLHKQRWKSLISKLKHRKLKKRGENYAKHIYTENELTDRQNTSV